MTSTPETRYRCDRCAAEATVPISNTPMRHLASPEGWLTLGVGIDPQQPPQHLCNKCGGAFHYFMGNHK